MICSKCGVDAGAYYTVKFLHYCSRCYTPEMEREITPNDHIVSFLKYYCRLSSPEYAIMIDGPWGTGKTWLLKQFFDYPEVVGIKFLYISVYGMTSFAEIENAMFQALHPILSSRTMSLASKLIAGTVKATTKVDLSNIGIKETSLTSQIPEISLPKYLRDTNEYILVLDDIERCLIDKSNLFGYINHLVEHKGHKAILLCNEVELVRGDESGKYLEIKEKLIGKTFVVEPDTTSAVNYFLSLLDDNLVRQIIIRNLDDIIIVYDKAGYKNLRHLKQGFLDFGRLISLLPIEAIENEEFISELVHIFMPLLIETKAGAISPIDIKKITTASLRGVISQSNGNNDESKVEKIDVLKKYGLFVTNLIFSEDVWCDFFRKGTVDSEVLRQSILTSSHFKRNSWPDWLKLWYYGELDDKEFIQLSDNVFKELTSCSLPDVGILVHVVGMLLSFIEQNLFQQTELQIIEYGKQNISFFQSNGVFRAFDLNSIRHSSWGGLGFHGSEIKSFVEFLDFIKAKQKEEVSVAMPSKADSLLEMMITDTVTFSRSITFCNYDNESFYNFPILRFIDPDIFVDAFIKLPARNKMTVSGSIADRYESSQFNSLLVSEVSWLQTVKLKLSEHQFTNKEVLSARWGKVLLDSIDKAILSLEKLSDKPHDLSSTPSSDL